MASYREKLRPFVPAAASFAAALLACVVLSAAAGGGVPPAGHTAAAACAVVLLASLVVPAISITVSGPDAADPYAELRRWARVAGGASGGTALGALAFAAAAARPVLLAALLSLVIVDACAFSFGALARALGKALGSRAAGGLAAGGALAGLVAAPFWSRGILVSAAGGWLAKPLVGASPFLAASVPWTSASASWTFDPRTSTVLYRIWVGTDSPVHYPSWVSCAAGHALAGLLLLAAAELPRVVRERRRERARAAG